MMIYPNQSKDNLKAIYFDNEGHVINYNVTISDKLIVMTSEKIENTPVFRLSYILLDNQTINVKFEMSQDGENFMTYIEGKSRKTE